MDDAMKGIMHSRRLLLLLLLLLLARDHISYRILWQHMLFMCYS